MNDETTKFCFKHEIEHDDFCPQCEMEYDSENDRGQNERAQQNSKGLYLPRNRLFHPFGDLGMKFVVVEIKHRTGFGTQWEESKPVAIFDTEKAANEWACNTATIEDYVVFDVPDFGCQCNSPKTKDLGRPCLRRPADRKSFKHKGLR